MGVTAGNPVGLGGHLRLAVSAAIAGKHLSRRANSHRNTFMVQPATAEAGARMAAPICTMILQIYFYASIPKVRWQFPGRELS